MRPPKYATTPWRDYLTSKTILGLCPLIIFANSGGCGLILGVTLSSTLLITECTLVLFGGNWAKSARIGAKVLLACATATFADLLLQAYFIELYPSIALGVALVSVTSALWVRDQKNDDRESSVSSALVTNLLLGLASTLILIVVGSTRAALTGSVFGFHTFWGIGLAAMPASALLLTGLLLALKNYMTKPNTPALSPSAPIERRVRVTGPIR